MLHEIVFKTNDTDKEVILKDIDNYHSTGYRCLLIVNSNGFMCRRQFEFENVDVFIRNLKNMQSSLSGEARLSEEYSDNYIQLKLTTLGKIELSGVITKFEEVDQMLEFGFMTDQTLLNELIRDFDKLIIK